MFDGFRILLELLFRVLKVDLILYNFICFVRSRFKEYDLIMLWSVNFCVNILYWNIFMVFILFWLFWCWSFLIIFWIVYCVKFLYFFFLWFVYIFLWLVICCFDFIIYSDFKLFFCGSIIFFLLWVILIDVYFVFYVVWIGFSDI